MQLKPPEAREARAACGVDVGSQSRRRTEAKLLAGRAKRKNPRKRTYRVSMLASWGIVSGPSLASDTGRRGAPGSAGQSKRRWRRCQPPRPT